MDLINKNASLLSNLANISAYLSKTMDDVSWVGFYLNANETLLLGPFQGNPACVSISNYNGVCGACLKQKKTQIVSDVHDLSYHIACDVGSNSEVVVPIIVNDKVMMVLDIDSYSLNRFSAYNDEIKELESLASEISSYLLDKNITNLENSLLK